MVATGHLTSACEYVHHDYVARWTEGDEQWNEQVLVVGEFVVGFVELISQCG